MSNGYYQPPTFHGLDSFHSFDSLTLPKNHETSPKIQECPMVLEFFQTLSNTKTDHFSHVFPNVFPMISQRFPSFPRFFHSFPSPSASVSMGFPPVSTQASTGARGLRPTLGSGVLVQASATLRAGTALNGGQHSWENHRKSWENTIEIEVFGWEIEVNGGFQWKILNGVLMVRLYITGMIKRMFSWD